MENAMKTKSSMFILLFILIVFSGCTTENNIERVLAVTSIPSPTIMTAKTSTQDVPTATSTVLLSPEPLQTLASTITPQATTPFVTATSVRQLTYTPLPTLESSEAEQKVEELLTPNKSCRLPCFGTITPGKSLWPDAKNYFSSFSESYFRGSSAHNFTFKVPSDLAGNEKQPVYIYTKNAQEIDLIASAWYGYPVQEMLADYGPPGEVYIFVSPLPFAPPGSVELVLYYPDQGFAALFEGKTGVGNNLQICPGRVEEMGDNPRLWVWAPGNVKTLKDISLFYGLGRDYTDYMVLQEAAGITVDEFYTRYKDPKSGRKCFEMNNPYSSK
jgi:hypothetical protein